MIFDVINNDLCVSCGLCSISGAKMKMKKGIYLPIFYEQLKSDDVSFLHKVCPGKGYDIERLGKSFYGSDTTYFDYRLGYYKSIGAASSNDIEFLKNSSSGGMMPTLAYYLLISGEVDGVVTVKYKYTKNGPVPRPFIARNKGDLIASQGSKYSPVPLLEIIDEILVFEGKLAVIGTPCQIAGLKLLGRENDILKNKIKYTIANFCGGYRDYRETERIFDIHNVNKARITHFRYRGDGQPGKMSIFESDKDPVLLDYPDYAKLTGYIKYYRCRVCVDATGELADISFGDAWLDEFIDSKKKWSAYLCRSEEIRVILERMLSLGMFHYSDVSKEKLLLSQKGNIHTKKERQYSRYRLYSFFGKKLPKFDRIDNKARLNILLEIKVISSQWILYLLEMLGLYYFVAKKIKRIKNEKK